MHPANTSPTGCTGKSRVKAPVSSLSSLSSLSKILVTFFISGFMALGTAGPTKAATFTITSTCDTVTSISGFTLMFDSVTYDQGAGTSEWNYTLEWDGTPPALSHFMIELCSTLTNADLIAVSPSDGSIGPDGSTGLYGIKWDDIENFPANTPVSYSFTLNGLFSVESGAFAPKAGINSNIALICGPSINCDVIDDCDTNSPPVANCPAGPIDMLVCDLSAICITGFTCFDVDDNLASSTVSVGTLSGDSVCFIPIVGANTIILTCVDSCGDTATCTTVVNVTLNSAPVATCPPGDTITTNDLSPICIPGFFCSDIDDNLLSPPSVNVGTLSGDTLCFTPVAGENLIILTCMDECGEVDVCSTIVFVNRYPTCNMADPDPEVFLCEPQEVCFPFSSTDPDGNLFGCEVVSGPGVVTGDSLWCYTPQADETDTVTIRCSDSLQAICEFTFVVSFIINTPPEPTCSIGSLDTTVCDLSDICIPGFSCSDVNGNLESSFVNVGTLAGGTLCFTPVEGANTIILTCVDSCGATAVCTTTVNVTVTSPPTITCPANATVECGDPSDTSVTGSATIVVSCDGNPTLTFSDAVTGASCNGDSLITRTWTVTDCCDNSASCDQLINITDTTPPVISCPANITIECDSGDPTGSATANDVCDLNPTIDSSDVVTPGQCTSDTTILRTWTATDCSGNSSSCTQTIEIRDTKPPIITCPVIATVECGDPSDPSVTGMATAVDSCDASPDITFADVITGTSCNGDSIITRTWTAVDCSGNSASCDQIINVTDTTPPVITCPSTATVECGNPSDPSVTGSATAKDTCDANPTISFSDAVTGNSCTGDSLITRTWTATDCLDNSSSCEQLINIVDTTPPVITCPANITIECGSGASTGSATATDCDPDPKIDFSDVVTQGQCPSDTNIVRTWTATDCNGNSSSCDQTITIRDTTPPVITCPAAATVECGAPRDTAVTGSATANDICDANPSITFVDVVVGQSANDTTVTRIWVATDCSGNTDTCVQIITVSCSILKTCIAITQTDRADDGSLLPGDQHSIQGDHEKVYVVHEAGNRRIGAFDFLIVYDNSALAFTGAEKGNVYTDREWEFFTFRFGPDDNCNGGCPSGKLRVIGIANQAGDGHTPLTFLPAAGDTLACLDFLVSNDRTLECQFAPIRFCWLDCGDNVLSDQTGDTLSISCKVYDYQGTGSLGAHANRAEITDVNADFPTLYGAPSACEVSGGPGKPAPDRKVNYKNGGIKIACADEIDARGDINLNGLSNEIADAVLYTKYFIEGPLVFDLAPAGQIAASDVNADGLPLTIADLVYLIRIIVGDALPIPKLAHNSLSVEFAYTNGVFSTSHDLGAALFVFNGQAEISLLQTRLELKIGYREGRTYALIAPSMESRSIGEYIHMGELIATDAALLSIEAADYDGAVVEAYSKVVVPTTFALHQNYPNPFNPSTKFSFDLPQQTAYTLSVYNISGQLVAEFNGAGVGAVEVEWNASSVASGMYFYKLSAGKFTSTRKALLLK